MTHPGIVLDDPHDGVPLPAGPAATPPEAASLVAALAATVADLHDVELHLGGFDRGDVVVDSDGRPRLCVTTLNHHDPEGARAADVQSIGSLLLDLLPRDVQSPPLTAIAQRAVLADTTGPPAREIAD